jgi:hypothetical protein
MEESFVRTQLSQLPASRQRAVLQTETSAALREEIRTIVYGCTGDSHPDSAVLTLIEKYAVHYMEALVRVFCYRALYP